MSTDITEEIRSSYRGSSVSRGEAFDRWLAEVKADAWDDGYAIGWNDGSVRRLEEVNPYRQGETE